MKYGAHVSSSGSLSDILIKSHSIGMHCIQIFLGSPKTYARRKLSVDEVKLIKHVLETNDMHIFSHFPYLLNMCKIDANMGSLQSEMNTMSSIGGSVVVHTGSASDGSIDNRNVKEQNRHIWEQQWKLAADELIANLNKLTYNSSVEYPLLLEPPAGEGKKICYNFEQIKYVFDRCPKEVGFCLDTCHTFAAGQCDFQTKESVEKLFQDVAYAIGDIKRLKLVHFNDSCDSFGAMKDNHEVLGKGKIWGEDGAQGMIHFWRLCDKYQIDVVSEVGSSLDLKVMKGLVKLILK